MSVEFEVTFRSRLFSSEIESLKSKIKNMVKATQKDKRAGCRYSPINLA